MAFMWKEDSGYTYKRMFPLWVGTSSNWGSNVFNLMLLNTKYSLQFAVGGNEFQKPDSFYQFTPHSHGSYPTKTTGDLQF
jgi:hypothetical protein